MSQLGTDRLAKRDQFKKGNKMGVGGARPGAGQPSDIYRSQCRELVKKHKIDEFFAQVASGKEIDFTLTMAGKKVSIPASIKNRLLAAAHLVEYGYGKAPQEITHKISPETLAAFEQKLISILNKGRVCPGCGTHVGLPPAVVKEIMKLSELFAVPAEETHEGA